MADTLEELVDLNKQATDLLSKYDNSFTKLDETAETKKAEIETLAQEKLDDIENGSKTAIGMVNDGGVIKDLDGNSVGGKIIGITKMIIDETLETNNTDYTTVKTISYSKKNKESLVFISLAGRIFFNSKPYISASIKVLLNGSNKFEKYFYIDYDDKNVTSISKLPLYIETDFLDTSEENFDIEIQLRSGDSDNLTINISDEDSYSNVLHLSIWEVLK